MAESMISEMSQTLVTKASANKNGGASPTLQLIYSLKKKFCSFVI